MPAASFWKFPSTRYLAFSGKLWAHVTHGFPILNIGNFLEPWDSSYLMAFYFPLKPCIQQRKEDRRMSKGSPRRPSKGRKTTKRDVVSEDSRNLRIAKDRKRKSRRSKVLIRQMRGMKWDENEYDEEFEEELEG